MTVNIPLSLNSYKPKQWAYITFKSQQMMDTAMEQSIALQAYPLKTLEVAHAVTHLKEHFNIGQSNNNNSSANRSRHRSCSQSKDRSNSRQRNHSANNAEQNNNTTNNTSSPNSSNFSNSTQSAQRPRSNERKGKDHSVSFFTSQRNSTATPNSSGHKPPLVDPNCSQIQEILSVLKSLQEDMASIRARIHALELADQRMSRLELRIFGQKQADVFPPDPNDSSDMLVDNHQRTPLSNTIQPAPGPSNRSFSDPVLPPPTVPVPGSTIPFSPIPETADEATIDKE
ncbi:hypothetical protein RhiirC2_801265, partial [Rhizophagus irregularis]